MAGLKFKGLEISQPSVRLILGFARDQSSTSSELRARQQRPTEQITAQW